MGIRRRSFGGYYQWVLDVVCETVEWPYQPLGFNSLALRTALDLKLKPAAKDVVPCIHVSQTTSKVPMCKSPSLIT